jgi:ubiquinone/menaquinone biosynthesis C-methylase UbiE
MIAQLRRIRRKLRKLQRSGKFADHTRADYQHLALREGNPVQRFWHRQKWPLVKQVLDVQPTDRVLDVGTGSSEIAIAAGKTCAFACGLDHSVSAMAFMQNNTAKNGDSRTFFLAGDIHHLPFRNGSFDKIIVLEVVEHLTTEGIPRYLGELRRVLSSSGVLLLTTPNYRSYWPVLEYLIDHFGGAAEMGGKQHLTHFSAHRLRTSLEANGFTVVQQGSVYHLSPFLSPLFSRLAESLFGWEVRKGGNLGPILFALARIAPI